MLVHVCMCTCTFLRILASLKTECMNLQIRFMNVSWWSLSTFLHECAYVFANLRACGFLEYYTPPKTLVRTRQHLHTSFCVHACMYACTHACMHSRSQGYRIAWLHLSSCSPVSWLRFSCSHLLLMGQKFLHLPLHRFDYRSGGCPILLGCTHALASA